MTEKYYVTVWCRALDSYEIEAESKEEAEKKALNIMYKQIPDAKNPMTRTESEAEMRGRETLNQMEKRLLDED
nr:MAG TPA_asm: RNA polymerase inhibitor [Caudoviricetes sp.]